ncbi:MAG: hypothetical protein AB6733_01230 [Clostridiaceae bacterium]
MIYNIKKVKKYYYKAYSLNIESEVFLPELISIGEKESFTTDIKIAYDKVPLEIKKEVEEGKTYKFEKNAMWFSIKEVAIYYIYNANTIIVEPVGSFNHPHIKIFLLGSAFGMLLLQKKYIAIHGSALKIGTEGVIFTGNSGAGKSTLANTLRERGYKFLADDISAVNESVNGDFLINPSFPQQKLCKDTMEKLSYNINQYTKVNDNRDKYAIPVGEDFFYDPVPLGAIFHLSCGEVEKVQITRVFGSEKMTLLPRNIYSFEVTKYTGVDPLYFKNCVKITKKVPIYKIVRPKSGYFIDEIIDLVLTTLNIK